MRTTVGPLPSGVYWRRRAVVAGALLLGVLILFISCSGGDEPKQGGGAGGTTTGTTAPASPQGAPDQSPSFLEAKPGNGPSLPDPRDVAGSPSAGQPGQTPGGVGDPPTGASTGPDVPVGAPANGQCGDAEMSITPVPARTAAKQGTAVEIRLKIRNISTRTCTRDVGADLQEIYLKQGARTVWSSDTCGTAKGSDLVQFPAGVEREYRVTWNGRDASRCADGLAVGPAPAVGVYQVFGRLGGKVSAPVQLSVTA